MVEQRGIDVRTASVIVLVQEIPDLSGIFHFLVVRLHPFLCLFIGRLRGRVRLQPLGSQLLKEAFDFLLYLVHLPDFFPGPVELLLHHQDKRLACLVWSI